MFRSNQLCKKNEKSEKRTRKFEYKLLITNFSLRINTKFQKEKKVSKFNSKSTKKILKKFSISKTKKKTKIFSRMKNKKFEQNKIRKFAIKEAKNTNSFLPKHGAFD